jgi:SAM-dependent methyltransferase
MAGRLDIPKASGTGPLAHGFNPQEFNDHIRAEWDAVAEDWGRDEWRGRVEAAAGGVSQRLLDLARVGPGDHVLDLGTGVGEPAGLAARRVGEAGRVVGIDLSPRMVEIGRRRMDRLGLGGIVELHVGDAGRPAWPAESFGAALSRWVLMLVPDLPAALGRIRRVLVPGGRLAVGLWSHPSRVPMIALALGAAEEMLGPPPTPEGAPTHLWMHGAEGFAVLLEDAGFVDVEADAVISEFDFEDPYGYARFVTAMAGPLRVIANSLPPGPRQELQERLAAAARRFAGGDGPLTIRNETLCLAARRA